jgi:hypothetical protein
MDLPQTRGFGFTEAFNGFANLLQGTSGPITLDTNGHVAGDDVWTGSVANDDLVGGFIFTSAAAHNNFFPEGGNFDLVQLESGTQDNVWFATYDIGHSGTSDPGTLHHQAVTDINAAGNDVFATGYPGFLEVTNFTVGNLPVGANNFADQIELSAFSWAHGAIAGGTDLGLRTSSNGVIAAGDATMDNVGVAGQATLSGIDVVLDSIAVYNSQADFVTALTASGIGNFRFDAAAGNVAAGGEVHHLVAVNIGTSIFIEDVSLHNTTGATQVANTANSSLVVSANVLIDLVGAGQVGNLAPHNIHFF